MSRHCLAHRTHSNPIVSPAFLTRCLTAIFVEFDKVAERHGKTHLVRCIEWIEPQRFLKPHYYEREAERVESRLQKLEVVGQPHQLSLLLQRDLFKLRRNRGSNGHLSIFL